MAAPVETPNAATTTKPNRSSKRVAHKAPLGWLPWLLLLLLALLIAGIVLALLAARDDDDSSSPSSSGTSQSQGDTSGGSSAALTTAAAGALVGGGGTSATSADAAGSALTGTRDAGTAGTVLFDEGSAALDDQARKVIAQAAANLQRAGVKSAEVIGYTDVVAGQPVNEALSQQRADAVAAALRDEASGITITTSAKGEQDPVASNSTDQGRQQNRRAAIVARG